MWHPFPINYHKRVLFLPIVVCVCVCLSMLCSTERKEQKIEKMAKSSDKATATAVDVDDVLAEKEELNDTINHLNRRIDDLESQVITQTIAADRSSLSSRMFLKLNTDQVNGANRKSSVATLRQIVYFFLFIIGMSALCFAVFTSFAKGRAVEELAQLKAAPQMTVADVRGWGYLTGKGHGALGLPEHEAVAIQEANAALIVAAPEMLAVLKEIFAPLGEGGYLPSCGKIVSDRARAIIAKASPRT